MVTCQASPIPPDISAWQRCTTNYTDPILGRKTLLLFERIFLGRAQTSWFLMSEAHLLYFYGGFLQPEELNHLKNKKPYMFLTQKRGRFEITCRTL